MTNAQLRALLRDYERSQPWYWRTPALIVGSALAYALAMAPVAWLMWDMYRAG